MLSRQTFISRATIKWSLRLTACFTALMIVWTTYFSYLDSPIDRSSTSRVTVTVKAGETFDDLSQALAEAGIVRSAWLVRFLVITQGESRVVKPGDYLLSKSMTTVEVVAGIASGKRRLRQLDWPAGMMASELPALVADAGIAPESAVKIALADHDIGHRFGIRAGSLEGYLYPGSYRFLPGASGYDILNEMVGRFKARWRQDLVDRATKLHLSRHEVVTLASFIESISSDPGEQLKVASVLHNRLSQKVKLESASKTHHGAGKPSPSWEDLEAGLPEGPIANPSPSALRAALFPAETRFLSFAKSATGELRFFDDTTSTSYNRDQFLRESAS